MLMETGILLFYIFRLIHISVFTPLTRFWSDTKNILILILIVVSLTLFLSVLNHRQFAYAAELHLLLGFNMVQEQ